MYVIYRYMYVYEGIESNGFHYLYIKGDMSHPRFFPKQKLALVWFLRATPSVEIQILGVFLIKIWLGQKLERPQMSLNGGMDTENVVYIHNGVLFSY